MYSLIFVFMFNGTGAGPVFSQKQSKTLVHPFFPKRGSPASASK
jgi:hypothetical protein